MRRLLAALAAALTLTLATACSGDGTPHGTVTGKEHNPARTTWSTETTYRKSCTTSTSRTGKKTSTHRSCRSIPNGTHRVAHRTAECWQLELDTGTEACVTAAKWLKTRVGDRI
ncbi:hypothetical protein [Streptomyces sp. NPDC051997]|uniref:hypothetical protein n=1 Tax=Streptomyces sp. NPDC051997 TaxID=3155611 RepID=UPI0034403B98